MTARILFMMIPRATGVLAVQIREENEGLVSLISERKTITN
jgi:hypothetical protein